MNWGNLVRLLGAAAIILGLEWAGFWVWMGAHPFWSVKVSLIGIAIGLVLALATMMVRLRFQISNRTASIVMVMLTLIAWFTYSTGKEQFVASFAENGLAGRFWYVGFMIFVGCVFASLVQISQLYAGKTED